MKLGIFTDPHYSTQEITCGKRFNSQSLRKIRQAYTAFEAARCDLVICLGDLIDKEPTHQQELQNLRDVAAVIQASPIRTFCLMGNHDAFTFTPAEFYGILGCRPQDLVLGNAHLKFLDACFFENGAQYAPGDSNWENTWLPPEQLQGISDANYIFIHQNIDPTIREDHRIANDRQVRAALEKSGNLKAVYQGHYHPGTKSEHNGIRYITLPAMCERENAFWITEV